MQSFLLTADNIIITLVMTFITLKYISCSIIKTGLLRILQNAECRCLWDKSVHSVWGLPLDVWGTLVQGEADTTWGMGNTVHCWKLRPSKKSLSCSLYSDTQHYTSANFEETDIWAHICLIICPLCIVTLNRVLVFNIALTLTPQWERVWPWTRQQDEKTCSKARH